ncbi:MAG: hypothetical protein QOE55_3227 [Acidobacteriaceae bacterium]|jgi:hypothetical protein|nr:hypothetical protein [Acidobacteriaceae bacterium]
MSDESLAIFIPGQWAVIPASRETLERCAVLKIWRRFGPLNGDVSERFLLIVAAVHLHLHHGLLDGRIVRSENVTQVVVTWSFAVSALTSGYIFEWRSSSSNEPSVWDAGCEPRWSLICSDGY